MESSSNSICCMMALGDNSNEPPPVMMMPLMTYSHQRQHQHHRHHSNADSSANTPFPPFHPLTATNQTQNRNSSCSSVIVEDHTSNINTASYFMDNTAATDASSVKAKIMAHPHYHRILAAYLNCRKVGAPPEVVAKLEEACPSTATIGQAGTSCVGDDPALDQFMEAYCEMLTKYEQELSKPFKEAMLFLQTAECQLKALTAFPLNSAFGEASYRSGSSEENFDVNYSFIDPQAEDQELKGQLLRRYSGYLGSLKQEFMKKRKKGKLPKEARQQLLDWWSRHYKWPYPSESQKLALAESTGLDQKQINNWFINQRKRHWKPSEDMQFVVMDATHPHYYMDTVLGNPFPMDLSPTLL